MTRPMPTLATTEPERDPLPAGFRDLYAEHYDFLWRCALRLGAHPADVEDVIQETFVVALRRYDPDALADGKARASTWLFAILHNVLRNHARGERRRRARLERIGEIEGDAVSRDHAEVRLGLRLLDEFLAELDADLRRVFVLSELEGMRGPEIARALGLNANTARSRLRTARMAFRARFDDEHAGLIEEAANVRAPAVAHARTLAVLMLPPGSWLGLGSSLGWLAGVRGLIGIGLTVVLGTGAAVYASMRAKTPAASIEPSPVRVALNPDTPAQREPAAVEPEPILEQPILVESKLPTPKPDSRRPANDDTAQALDALARARTALLDGDAQASLDLLAAQRWPAALEARRVALEVGALCSLGRVTQARTRAHEWLDAHGETSTALDLREVCWDEPNTSKARGHSSTESPSGHSEEN